jgi:hypothetical protein
VPSSSINNCPALWDRARNDWVTIKFSIPLIGGTHICRMSPPVSVTVGNFSPAMGPGGRNQVGIGLSYRPASLWVCSLATQFQTRFLESIPRPIAGLKSFRLIARSGKLFRNRFRQHI